LEDVRQDQENKRMQQNLLSSIYRSQHSEVQNTKKEMKSFDDRATKAHCEKEHLGFQLNANAYEDKLSKNVKFQEQILDKSLSPDTKLKNYSMFLKIKDGV
jgi:DNA polymerase III alpha subunit